MSAKKRPAKPKPTQYPLFLPGHPNTLLKEAPGHQVDLEDKVNVIKRNEKFQRELNSILQSGHAPKTIQKRLDALAERWGVPGLVYDRLFPDVAAFDKDRAVKIISDHKNYPMYIDLKSRHKKGCEYPIRVSKKKNHKEYALYVDYTAYAEGGRYLTIKVDLWEKKDTLMKEFEEIIDSRPRSKKRKRDTTGISNPWHVYDLKKQGKTYEQIVMELMPTRNKDLLLSRMETARKACRRAREMIRRFTPQ